MTITKEMCLKMDKHVKPTSYNHSMVIDGSVHYTIMRIVQTGKVISEIGEIVGMHKSTVYDCIKRMGITKYGPGIKLCGKRSGNNRTFPKRAYVYLKSNCKTCGDLIYHHQSQCNWCRGKNATQIHETDNTVS